MISFLFWNLKKQSLNDLVFRLSREYDVDVFMFAESDIPPAEMLQSLNRPGSLLSYHFSAGSQCKRISIYSRFRERFIRPISEDDKYTIRKIELPGLEDILLVVLHFPSKLYMSDDDQAMIATWYIGEIVRTETEIGHSRTVVVGDFNMNPFETGVISARGFHSVMTRQIAKKRSRIVQKKEYQYFYNPMWNYFGEFSPGPPGTFYYRSSKPNTYFWNIFDQVLIRPDLLDRFNDNALRIVDSIGGESLLTEEGLPDDEKASDHLPIYFVLDL